MADDRQDPIPFDPPRCKWAKHGRQKGAQQPAEGMQGPTSRAKFLEQIQSGPSGKASDPGHPHDSPGKQRLFEQHEQHGRPTRTARRIGSTAISPSTATTEITSRFAAALRLHGPRAAITSTRLSPTRQLRACHRRRPRRACPAWADPDPTAAARVKNVPDAAKPERAAQETLRPPPRPHAHGAGDFDRTRLAGTAWQDALGVDQKLLITR